MVLTSVMICANLMFPSSTATFVCQTTSSVSSRYISYVQPRFQYFRLCLKCFSPKLEPSLRISSFLQSHRTLQFSWKSSISISRCLNLPISLPSLPNGGKFHNPYLSLLGIGYKVEILPWVMSSAARVSLLSTPLFLSPELSLPDSNPGPLPQSTEVTSGNGSGALQRTLCHLEICAFIPLFQRQF